MQKKKILIISITNQDNDPRVIRQVDFLKNEYDITCCGLKNSFISKNKFIKISSHNNTVISKIVIGTLKLFRFYDTAENFVLNSKLRIEESNDLLQFDLIIANDFDTLALALKKFKTKKVIADFHEYAPSEFEDKLYWKYIHKNFVIHQCRKYFPYINAITTVCNSIAKEYEKEFDRKPVVITNAASYVDLKPFPVRGNIRMIHHGAAISSRKIEIMIEVAKLLDDRFTLDLMLIPNEREYFNKLKFMAAGIKNIKFIEPVRFEEIVKSCNPYDIGIFILPPVNLNYEYALPNKFFEFIQSRLAIVTGPSKEMSDYIDKYELGLHTKTFVPLEIAKEIKNLSEEQIIHYKKNSDKHAKELSSVQNKKILKNIVKEILAD